MEYRIQRRSGSCDTGTGRGGLAYVIDGGARRESCPTARPREGTVREDRRDDLVSTTAIVAGTVVGIAATVVSLWLSAEEAAPPEPPIEAEEVSTLHDQLEVTIVVGPNVSTGEAWTDPRGPERGPNELEWEVISTYKTIESMTSTEPGDDAVDRALVELGSFAKEHPESPFVQELHLKGLRVASYWAFDGGDLLRAAQLHGRFEVAAERAVQHDLTVRESMRMLAQRIGQRCDGAEANVRELRRLATLFPNEHTEAVLTAGVEAASGCEDAVAR